MTIDDVKRRVEEIRKEANDDEAAHSMEDGLHQDVLHAIAMGHPDAKDLAAEALRTRLISFCRWCA